MKIVDVAEFYATEGGGVRTYIHHKLRAAATAGHEAVVIAPGPETRTEWRKGGRIEWIRSRPMPFDPRYYLLLDERAVHARLDEERPDVVEGSSPWTGGWMTARWRGSALKSLIFHQDPVAVYGHTLLARQLGYDRTDRLFGFYFRYLQRLSAHYDLTVTSGRWLAERLTSKGVHGAAAVPFGVCKSRFLSARPNAELRRSLLTACGVQQSARLLVAVSRHHPEKRLLSLLDGFAEAKKRSPQPLALVVYGDGPLRGLVERKARRIGNVHVAGFSTDPQHLAAVLASGDAFVHGSAAETFGIVIAEAMAAGLPLVVPNRGGANELAHPTYAETYEPGDAMACAAAIGRLLGRDLTQLGHEARRTARRKLLDMDEHFTLLFDEYANRLGHKVPVVALSRQRAATELQRPMPAA